MSQLFNLTITTEHGSSSGSIRANSIQQITDMMPNVVTHYEAVLVPLTGDTAVVDDTELQLDLLTDVSNIEYASTMTPERIAEEHAKQRSALRGVTVRIGPTTAKR